MDATSDRDLQRTPPAPTEAYDEMKRSQAEAQQKDPLAQVPENSANENEILKKKNVEISIKDNEKPSSGEESSTSKKEQLMVKLKYKTKTITTSPPDQRSPTNASSLGASLVGKSSVVFTPSSGSIVIEKETGEHLETFSHNSKANDLQIEIEKSGDDEALALNPLDEPTEELSQVNVIKDEPDHDLHQQIEHPSKGPVRDEMDDGAYLGDDAMHVPVNDNIFKKSEKAQETVAVEQRRVDDVDGDYQQSGSASPGIARGGNTALGENYMSDEINLNRWFPNAMNQSGDVGQVNGSQRGRDLRAIDHPVNLSDSIVDQMDVQQQYQVEQLPQTFNTVQSDLGVQDVWSQSHPDFSDPVHFTNKSSSPHHRNSSISIPAVTLEGSTKHRIPSPHHVSQQLSGQYGQLNFNPDIDRQEKLRAQVGQKKRQLENLKNLNEERARQIEQSSYGFSHARTQLNAPRSFLVGPLTYQRAPHFSNPQLSNRLSSTGFQQPTLPTISYGQLPPNMSYSPNPASLCKRVAKTPVPLSSNNWMPGPYVSQGLQEARKQVLDENDCGDEGDASNDDEPLRTRVKHHLSVTSSRDSVTGMLPPPTASNGVVQHPRQDDNSDVEFVATKAKPKHAVSKIVENRVHPSHPLPQPEASSSPVNNATPFSEVVGEIDWTLPRYEIRRQPLAKGEEIPSAKVSLPGLVREELLLSPDHADEEVHLLMNIFIPNQRALPNPDPEPAIALLNFHTIAVLVIEAYVQHEIGDEFGTGRGHFHTQHDRGDAEYERMRDAIDADANEIFFAVVDRYRAGLESKKKPLQLIRGTQEFCDVALDVIYYIKEHGLLRPEPKARAVRVDKGVKRGPRGGKASDEKEVAKGKGTKRGTTAKPNEVLPRKKAKTAAVVEVKKKRAKPKTLGVTVVRR